MHPLRAPLPLSRRPWPQLTDRVFPFYSSVYPAPMSNLDSIPAIDLADLGFNPQPNFLRQYRGLAMRPGEIFGLNGGQNRFFGSGQLNLKRRACLHALASFNETHRRKYMIVDVL